MVGAEHVERVSIFNGLLPKTRLVNVLFLTNGLGLGNSTRCHAIIQYLTKMGAEVEIITSGNGLWYFANKPEVTAIHTVKPLAYGSSDGSISILKTVASIADMFRTFQGNAQVINKIINSKTYDVIVTDSEYNIFPFKKRGIPVAALNNSDVIYDAYFAFKDTPASIRAQFFAVEMLDNLFHKTFPDLVISPSIDPNAPERAGNLMRVGPIVREEFTSVETNGDVQRIAVMLSGSVFGTPVAFENDHYPARIDVIGRTRNENATCAEEVVFHGKIKDTSSLLINADLAVVNGGFSAVSELFWLRKPLVVVPVPRHAEQWINARMIQKLGVGMIASPDNYESVMIDALSRIDDFRAAYRELPLIGNGAKKAADAIINLARQKL